MAKTVKMTVADAIADAFSEFESLGNELCEWADNIEEKFSNTSKYETLRASQETLEGLSAPDVPDEIGKLEIEVPVNSKKRLSRADRNADATIKLDIVIEKLDELIEKTREDETDHSDLRDELDNAKAEVEAVEFPGMYG